MTASTRRAALGAILAAPLASVSVAATAPHSGAPLPEREAKFLALAPRILPLARTLNAAGLEAHRRYEAAEEAAGPFPGLDSDRAHRAWIERSHAVRDINGYHEAWAAMNAADVALTPLVDGFDEVEMTTMSAILLKAMLIDLGDWWRESVIADLQRYAEAQLCA